MKLEKMVTWKVPLLLCWGRSTPDFIGEHKGLFFCIAPISFSDDSLFPAHIT